VRPPLRDYQQRSVELLRRHHAERPILCLPTGAGKTSVASEVIRLAVERGGRALFLVHRRELVDQAVSRLAQYDIQAGRILAGFPEARTLPVQVASIQSLARRAHWPASMVLVDECSHAVSASWASLLDRYTSSTVIGLTATPCRLDGQGLGAIFGRILEPVTASELIERGHLIDPIVYAPPFDASRLKVRGGEYALPEVAERMDKLTGSITRTWQQHAAGLRTVVFACTVEHSLRIVDAFRARGVAAAHIDYGTAPSSRDRALRSLRDGSLTILSQVQLLSEGWDLPALQAVILARPTKSLALFRQMVGRVMRPPGPVYVLDHAGNHNEHGPVTAPVQWSLDSKPKKEGTGLGVRTCKACFAVIPPQCEECPQCGEPCESVPRATPPVHAPGELVRFARLPPEVRYAQIVRQASDTGRAIGWARHIYRLEYGTWPKRPAIEAANYTCTQTELTPKCPKCLKPHWSKRSSEPSAPAPTSGSGAQTS
jgi:DNA repair protein RadD